MCFSASASFTASWFLAGIGIAALVKIKKPSQTMFAVIPLLFAAQQAIEGLLWLSFTNQMLMPYASVLTYGFLFFAFIIWPTWIPCSLWVLEPHPRKKITLSVFSFIGMITSASLCTWLLYSGATSTVSTCHILYQAHVPNILFNLGTLFYLTATIMPFFFSDLKHARYVGFTLAASYLISYYFYYEVLVSIWCFFAALLSVGILIIL
jgi:Family of unknown function (DUF6629)